MGHTREAQRGAQGQFGRFAMTFVRDRMEGFRKDVQICLTPVPHLKREGENTHAYFPTLMSCCATLEYLAGLWGGIAGERALGHPDIAKYAAEFLGAQYDNESILLLWGVLRSSIMHRGISSGVWVEKDRRKKAPRRVVWRLDELDAGPALALIEEVGTLESDSPWPTPFTHRLHVHLGRLAGDIDASACRYAELLERSQDSQDAFRRCMERLYPKV